MRFVTPLLLLVLASCGGRFKLDPKTPYQVMRSPSSVLLEEGLSTRMEITVPEGSTAAHPTVVLVHGRGPADMDGTLESHEGATAMFTILSDELTARGFTVVRYHQRHVTGPGQVDRPAFVADRDVKIYAADLKAVLATVKGDARVDPERVFLLGFDEGTVVATAVAVEDASLAGLVLIGASAVPFRDQFRAWFDDLTLPYLERFSIQGQLDGRLLARAVHTAATEPAVQQTRMLGLSFTRDSNVIQPSPLVDANRDGILSIDKEIEPAIPVLVDFALGPLGQYQYRSAARDLPTVSAQLPNYDRPLLVLHGRNDAYAPVVNAERLQRQIADLGRTHQEVQVLDAHGHSLGFASEPVDDLPRPMSGQARSAVGDWLVRTASR